MNAIKSFQSQATPLTAGYTRDPASSYLNAEKRLKENRKYHAMQNLGKGDVSTEELDTQIANLEKQLVEIDTQIASLPPESTMTSDVSQAPKIDTTDPREETKLVEDKLTDETMSDEDETTEEIMGQNPIEKKQQVVQPDQAIPNAQVAPVTPALPEQKQMIAPGDSPEGPSIRPYGADVAINSYQPNMAPMHNTSNKPQQDPTTWLDAFIRPEEYGKRIADNMKKKMEMGTGDKRYGK